MIITASRRIAAAPEKIYSIIADYKNAHPKILPKQFKSLVVEEGGYGAGTIIRYQLKAYGTTQEFRASVTEPRPGRELAERIIGGVDLVTVFTLAPVGDSKETDVTLATDFKTRTGLLGRIEGYLSHRLLQPMFVEELALLDTFAGKPDPPPVSE